MRAIANGLQSGLAEYFLYNIAYFSLYRYNAARI